MDIIQIIIQSQSIAHMTTVRASQDSTYRNNSNNRCRCRRYSTCSRMKNVHVCMIVCLIFFYKYSVHLH